MKKLLIATFNPAKLREITKFLSDLPVQLVGLSDVGITQDYKETGETFEENAIGKARFYSQLSQLPTIADDGGLEIDALNGAPGIYSKRWIGKENATTQEYIDFTLHKLEHVPDDKRGVYTEHPRSAQLRSVIALAFPDGRSFTAESKVRGIIPRQPSAHLIEGFPYRSLLFISEIGKFYHSEDMTEEEIIKYNHRRRSLEKLKEIIRAELI